jgi:hypothetical protein
MFALIYLEEEAVPPSPTSAFAKVLPDKVVSAECGICQNALEDDFHLFVGCRLKWCVWQKALQELSLDSILQTKDQVWMSLLLDQKSKRKDGNLLSYLALIMSCIWRSHWQYIIEGTTWSVEACLANIRNQRYGQLANQYHQKPMEENAGRLIPISTVYVEDAKNPDPFFEPYHTSFD